MKKKHERHFRVLSMLKDTLLFEVDEWRERELSRLMEEKDPTVATLTREGAAAAASRRRKRGVGVMLAIIAALLLLGAVGLFFLLRGGKADVEAPHTHTLSSFTQEATCTEWGYTEERCTLPDCDYRHRTEEYAPTGHTERVTGGKAPSYTEAGYTDRIDCSVCGALLKESTPIPMLYHHFAVSKTVAPTCTESGYTLYICTDEDCTESYEDDFVGATGHSQDTPVRENEIAADCTREGSCDELIYCSACHTLLSKRSVTLPSTHGVQTVVYRGGDCTTGACYEVEECQGCGEVCSRTELTLAPQAGHTVVDGVCTGCGMPESTAGLEYEFIEAQNEYRVIGIGSCTEKNIVIGTYLGHTVSEVGGLTKADIETLTLSDGVRTVAANAVENCPSLTSVTMGEGVRTIDLRAFSFCPALSDLSLGKNVETIGTHAFWGCTALTGTFSIPASVTSLAHDAFTGTGISAFDVASDNPAYAAIDGNLYTKDGKTLMDCAPEQTKTRFVVPDGVEKILQGAIHVEAFTEIVIPKSVWFIYSRAIHAPLLEAVVFEDPSGWTTRFGNPIDESDFADPKTAKDILTALNDGFIRSVH